MEATTLEKQPDSKNRNKKHPPGLYLLFATEAWERFSYYGMRAILVLYLTKSLVEGGLGMNQAFALSLYGFFTGAVYLTPLVGGWLTDRFLGQRLAITLGGIVMALGNLVLFAHHSQAAVYAGLIILVIGNGFFKPNISTIVGELYDKEDTRRDAAFTIFYMGINLGAFFSPLVIGFITDKLFAVNHNGHIASGYQYGFLTSAIGMVIGQVLFNALGNRYLGDIGKKPTAKRKVETQGEKITAPLSKKEKQRTAVVVILTAFVIFFWAGFEQAGGALTVYTDEFVNRDVFGFVIPTEWFQSVNPLFIIIFAPMVSALWIRLSRSNRDLPVPVKMGLGMILLGLGYLVLLLAIMKTGSDEHHIVNKANLLYIIVTYFFQTVGELFLSPVGLSTTSKISPPKYASLLMGVWLASSGIANILAGQLGGLTASLGYLEVFGLIGLVTIVFGLILLAFSKKVVQLME